MEDVFTFLPPPPGVEMLTAWEGPGGKLRAEHSPLVCIKAISQSGLDDFDAMSAEGDCLNDRHGPARALLLADGRVVIPGIDTFPDVQAWLEYLKEAAAPKRRRNEN